MLFLNYSTISLQKLVIISSLFVKGSNEKVMENILVMKVVKFIVLYQECTSKVEELELVSNTHHLMVGNLKMRVSM